MTIRPTLDGVDEATTKTCPKCAEDVQPAAQVCKHCGYRFTGRTWMVWAGLAVGMLLVLGLMWNQNRLEQERQDNNVCSLMGTC